MLTNGKIQVFSWSETVLYVSYGIIVTIMNLTPILQILGISAFVLNILVSIKKLLKKD
jgi:hypothetical protein